MLKSTKFSLLVLLICNVALAQTLVVQRNVNLRRDPSTGTAPISVLTPPASLALLPPHKQSGFYNVRTTAGQQGWVWARNVQLSQAPLAQTRLGPAEIYADIARTPGFANPGITQDNIAENLSRRQITSSPHPATVPRT